MCMGLRPFTRGLAYREPYLGFKVLYNSHCRSRGEEGEAFQHFLCNCPAIAKARLVNNLSGTLKKFVVKEEIATLMKHYGLPFPLPSFWKFVVLKWRTTSLIGLLVGDHYTTYLSSSYCGKTAQYINDDQFQ